MAIKKKDLKKMSKRELLEIMLLQSKKIDELENEIEKMNNMLDDKKILLSNCGSIAEAALKLNNIFEAAQNAADQYLKNIEMLSKEELALRKSREEAEALKNKTDLVKETALLVLPAKVKRENIFKRFFKKIRGVFKFKKKNRRRRIRKIVIKEKRVSKPSKILKIKSVLGIGKEKVKNGFSKIGSNIKSFLIWGVNGIKTVLKKVKESLKKFFGRVREIISKAFGKSKVIVSKILTKIKKILSKAFGKIKEVLKKYFEKVKIKILKNNINKEKSQESEKIKNIEVKKENKASENTDKIKKIDKKDETKNISKSKPKNNNVKKTKKNKNVKKKAS